MKPPRFPVEAGHVMMFARAIGDPNPRYYAGADLVSDRADVIAPPTFAEALIHYDQEFAYRPRIGERWFGSAAEPSTGPAPPVAAGPGTGDGTSFHAETHFEYHGLLRAGDVLDVRHRRGERWEKRGARGGRLWFDSYIAEFFRGDVLLLTSTTVVVTTESKIDPGAGTSTSQASAGGLSAVPAPADDPGTGLALTVGDARQTVLVENLSRAQIFQYAGASGDFSPQHTDEIWNTRVGGYPSVFAHGMLTMGMTGRLLTDWFGQERLRAFDMRFSRQVWPGDTLVAAGEVTEIGSGEARVALVTSNARGEIVASGSARIALP